MCPASLGSSASLLADRVALVTGANRGIGLAVAHGLARLGARVVVGSRDYAAGEIAAAALREQGCDAQPVWLDVVSPASLDAARAAVEERHRRLDILINNAGVISSAGTLTGDVEEARRVLDVNVLGVWRVTATMAPLLRRGRHARVVNVSSGAGSIAELPRKLARGECENFAAYRVSKAAVNALTRIQAAELAPDGVLVNAACPGWVDTEMGRSMGATADDRTAAEGAQSIIDLVLLANDGPSGGFFRDGVPLAW